MENKEFHPTVELSLNTIINECTKNIYMNYDHFLNIRLKNREFIGESFRYKKFNDDFCDTFLCYNDGNFVVGNIKANYNEFLRKLVKILNLNINNIVDDDNLTKKLNERLDVLKNIKKGDELKKEFPILYKDLQDGRKYLNDLIRYKNQERIKEKDYFSGEHYFYSCALRRNLFRFINEQHKMYTRYVNNRSELKKQFENYNYNGYLKKYFDIDKLYMYVADRYLSFCENSNDKEKIMEYLRYLIGYIKCDRKKDFSITTDNGMRINYDNIVRRTINLKRRMDDNSSLVNWVIVPDSKDLKKVSEDKKNKRRTTILNLEEINRLKNIGEAKCSYYESTNYVAKAIGLRKYKGYVAYIYENGEIILDREYDIDRPNSALGNAIYNIKVEDFELLSKLDKKTLRNCSGVRRIIHSQNWNDRVRDIIERPATDIEKQNVKTLVKRLNKKNY